MVGLYTICMHRLFILQYLNYSQYGQDTCIVLGHTAFPDSVPFGEGVEELYGAPDSEQDEHDGDEEQAMLDFRSSFLLC